MEMTSKITVDDETVEWAVRPATDDDMRFVFNSWINSFRRSPWAGVLQNHRAYALHAETIRALIARGAVVSVACNAERPTQILGWACTEQGDLPVLHYVYVKDFLRQRGLATALLRAVGVEGDYLYTFRTSFAKYLPKNGRHAPGAARRKDL